jgi:hypothetical protein
MGGNSPSTGYFHVTSSFCILFGTGAYQVVNSDGISAHAQ